MLFGWAFRPQILLSLAVIAVLVGCGGGGGGGGDDAIIPPPATNRAPTANTIVLSVAKDTPLVIDIAAQAGNALGDAPGSVTTTSPTNGSANVSGMSVTYTPNSGFSGLDSFTYTIIDADRETAQAIVSITVGERVGSSDTFTLSGNIVAPVVTATDSDTNDPNAPVSPNDTPAQAPTIGNPITLGGYVNVAGTGEPGRSQANGDRNDYYRVELLAGQVITLLVSDFQTGDADLYLYDSSEKLVDTSMEVGEIESLTVPADGVYFVNPYAYSGASNYTLVIGNSEIASAGGMRLSNQFVAGQAIVEYDNSLLQSQGLAAESAASQAGFSVRAGAPNRQMLMELDPSTVSLASASTGDTRSKADSLRNAEDRKKWRTLNQIKAMSKNPSVVYAEPNYLHQATAIPNDPYYNLQWHYPLINLPAAWDLETGSADVVVAVIDTGVLLNHPDLQGQLVPGYDFIRDDLVDGDGIDSNPDDPGVRRAGLRSSFHGTHVAGTIAAASNNREGVASIAWGAKIMPLRVLGLKINEKGKYVNGSGTSYDILQAVRYAAGLANDSGTVPAQRASIINLSLGGSSYSRMAQDVYTEARNAGVIIVAASGNSKSAVLSYPASYDGVISVSAVNMERRLAPYSNFGTAIDIAAPGGYTFDDKNADGVGDGVYSTLADDTSGLISFTYEIYHGTSMASPHVAGVLALVKSANGNVTPAVVDQLLSAGNLTDDIGTPGWDNKFGFGLINAHKAVTAALNLSGTPLPNNPALGVTPASLNFDIATTAIEITARNTNTGNLQLYDINADQPWIGISPLNIGGSGLGTYLVTVERNGLADGIYSGKIALQSDANSITIPVVMSIGGAGAGGDVGHIYVVLVDPATGAVIDQLTPPLDRGNYSYAFTNVPAGNFVIAAGTDSDNDNFLCDSGEACGIYPIVGNPVQVDVDRDLSGLNFPISYTVALPSLAASHKDGENSKTGFYRLKTPSQKQTKTAATRYQRSSIAD